MTDKPTIGEILDMSPAEVSKEFESLGELNLITGDYRRRLPTRLDFSSLDKFQTRVMPDPQVREGKVFTDVPDPLSFMMGLAQRSFLMHGKPILAVFDSVSSEDNSVELAMKLEAESDFSKLLPHGGKKPEEHVCSHGGEQIDPWEAYSKAFAELDLQVTQELLSKAGRLRRFSLDMRHALRNALPIESITFTRGTGPEAFTPPSDHTTSFAMGSFQRHKHHDNVSDEDLAKRYQINWDSLPGTELYMKHFLAEEVFNNLKAKAIGPNVTFNPMFKIEQEPPMNNHPVSERFRCRAIRSTVVVAPTIEHVKILQAWLVDKLPQGEILLYENFTKDNPAPQGSLVFFQADDPFATSDVEETAAAAAGRKLRFMRGRSLLPVDELDMFLCKDFLLVNDKQIKPCRDYGYNYGDRDTLVTSDSVLSNWPMILNDSLEQ